PAQLVDLAVGLARRLLDDRHPPPAHDLGLAAHLVARGRELLAQRGAHAGLLEHLAQGGGLEGLARVELALGPRPVGAMGAVDDEDAPVVAHDQASGGLDHALSVSLRGPARKPRSISTSSQAEPTTGSPSMRSSDSLRRRSPTTNAASASSAGRSRG